jgi:hypothetical protein
MTALKKIAQKQPTLLLLAEANQECIIGLPA